MDLTRVWNDPAEMRQFTAQFEEKWTRFRERVAALAGPEIEVAVVPGGMRIWARLEDDITLAEVEMAVDSGILVLRTRNRVLHRVELPPLADATAIVAELASGWLHIQVPNRVNTPSTNPAIPVRATRAIC